MKQAVWTAAVTLAVTGAGCQHQSSSRINGPSESREGVKVEILKMQCRPGTDDPNVMDFVDLAMDVAVTNRSNQSVQFRPNRMRVVDDARGDIAAGSGPSTAIPRGEQRVVQVRFGDSLGPSCKDRMKLDLRDSLTLGEPVHEEPIGFIPKD